MAIIVAAVTSVSWAQQPSVWKWPTRINGDCEYHPTPAGAVALVAGIPDSSRHLRPDGKGRYWEGNDTVRSYTNSFYMLFTYWPETCEQPAPARVRALEFRLDDPVAGAIALGNIRDQDAMLYIGPPAGLAVARKPDEPPPLQRMRVGNTAYCRRALLRFHRGGKIYYLRFGTEAFSPGMPGYVELLPGQGTTAVRISRTEEFKWTIATGSESLGRLSLWGAEPVDLGLYRFSFEIQLELQRQSLN